MQAVILAAGQGKRLRPLTEDRPKPMVELLGKPILEYTIDFLPPAVDEIILVIGYHGEKIRQYFGDSWKGRSLKYVVQDAPQGTAQALFLTRPFVRDRFLLVNGDNINDLGKAVESVDYPYALFAIEHPTPEHFGVIETNPDMTLKRIVEKPEHPATNLISTGSMILSPGIFEAKMVLDPKRQEYFVPALLMQIMEREPIHILKQDFWVAVDRPEDIPKAEAALLNKVKR